MDIEIAIKDPMLRAYLPSLFAKAPDGSFVAGIKNLTGAAICLFARIAPQPRPHPMRGNEQVVHFTLAATEYNRPLKNQYLYIRAADEVAVNSVLRREFNNDFYEFCEIYHHDGFTINETIERFIVERKMDVFFLGGIESLRKRVYRHQQKMFSTAKERLRQKVYYRNKRKRRK